MIVGTAGHIDHGKTTLVKALTGVDADRLPEEKRRGITIELGYAFMDGEAAERIGFIDVPGHERLVHTMLAGATGIDFGLLLVAADDGVMPQTREHAAVFSLLGVSRGAVAVTKIDRAEPRQVASVCDEARALLAGTPLAGAPVLPVSAHTGAGLEALRALLFYAARTWPRRPSHGAAFRLAIDRAFTLDGVGTVVTGTVHAGRVQVGDELVLTPSAKGHRVRVRSLHAQNQSVGQAHAGQRCALGLAGIGKDEVSRGQWLTAPGIALATDRLDATLLLWRGEARALRSGTPVHVHVGSSDTLGAVAVLQVDGAAAGDTIAPGAHGTVQIVLCQPIGAWHGDRIVLRDNSASRTIAGGAVLDPFAPARYRRTPQRLAELTAWSLGSPAARLAALVGVAPQGVSLQRWASAEGLDCTPPPAVPHDALEASDGAHGNWALGAAHRGLVGDALLSALRTFHERQPDELGPDSSRLRRLAAPRLPEPLWRALVASLQAAGSLAARSAFVYLPEHGLRLSATDERLAQKIAPLLATAGFDGSWARDLARDAQEGEALMRTTLARLAQRGELHQVVRDLVYPVQTMAALAALARGVAAQSNGEVTAARFRDATGLGRKRAIQVLEYFDRVGLLRRVGDVHRLRGDTTVFAESD